MRKALSESQELVRLITGTVRDKTVTDRLSLSKQQKENLQQIFGWAIPGATDQLRSLTFLPRQPERHLGTSVAP